MRGDAAIQRPLTAEVKNLALNYVKMYTAIKYYLHFIQFLFSNSLLGK